MKKNISCILALVLIINLFSSSVTVYAATASYVTANIETVNMGTFVKAFTDADMANNFENYAASGSAIDFSDISNMPASIVQPNESAENYFANVVGTVYDKETGEVLPGTQVLIDSLGVSITTDQRGRFSIENVPVGEYTVRICANNYQEAVYSNMPVECNVGAVIYSLAISKVDNVIENFLMTYTDDEEDTFTIPEIEEDIGDQQSELLDTSSRLYDPPNLLHLIVKYTNSNGTVEYHSFGSANIDEYLYYVVPSEMYFGGLSLTNSQKLEAYKAQAVASRTYADYKMRFPTQTDHGPYICSTASCQVYKPYFTNQLAISAVQETSHQILFDDIGNYRLSTEFHGTCGGKTTFNNQQMVCTSHPLNLSVANHNRGMCQNGAVSKAMAGQSYTDILSYYYPASTSVGVSLVTAGNVQTEGINPGEKKRISGMSEVEYVFTVSKTATYYFLASSTTAAGINAQITVKKDTGSPVSTGKNSLQVQLSPGRYSVTVKNNASGNLSAFFDIRCPESDTEVFARFNDENVPDYVAYNYMQGCIYKQVKFVPESTKTYTFATSTFMTNQNLYMAILDSNSSIVQESTNTTGYPSLSYQMTAGETYYIIVCQRAFLSQQTMNSATNFDVRLRIT